jgi:hypothetical protein
MGSSTNDEPRISAKYQVESGGRTYDAFAIAEGCIRDWETYLSDKGLH